MTCPSTTSRSAMTAADTLHAPPLHSTSHHILTTSPHWYADMVQITASDGYGQTRTVLCCCYFHSTIINRLTGAHLLTLGGGCDLISRHQSSLAAWQGALVSLPHQLFTKVYAVGWVIWPVKILPEMTYNVSSETRLYSVLTHSLKSLLFYPVSENTRIFTI